MPGRAAPTAWGVPCPSTLPVLKDWTDRLSPVSCDDVSVVCRTPDKISAVTLSPSFTDAKSSCAKMTGSAAPLMVTVTSCGTVPPLPSSTVRVKVSVKLSPASIASKSLSATA